MKHFDPGTPQRERAEYIAHAFDDHASREMFGEALARVRHERPDDDWAESIKLAVREVLRT